jgi:hypothetical protein
MKTLVMLLLLLVSSVTFAAEPGFLEVDLNNRQLQGGAPNSSLTQLLTVASTTVNMTGTIWWSMYTATACKFRILPTTANGNYPQDTAISDARTSFLVNKVSPFINFSGCTGAVLQRQ